MMSAVESSGTSTGSCGWPSSAIASAYVVWSGVPGSPPMTMWWPGSSPWARIAPTSGASIASVMTTFGVQSLTR